MRLFGSGTDDRRRGATTTATAVMLLVTLATGAGVALGIADRTLMTSVEYRRHTAALMLAEAAVEDAMAHLDEVEDWSNLSLPVENFTAPHSVGSGIAWADLKNDLSDGGGSKDTNGYVLIKGYGQALNSDYVENVEVLYWRPKFTIPPVAGVIMCGYDLLDAGQGNVSIDGYNHYLPPAPCTGSHCNPVRNGEAPDVAGVAFEIAGQESKMSLPKTLDGVPQLASGVCSLQGKTGLCARIRNLTRNIRRLTGLETITSWPISGKGSYGSVGDPRILHVAKGTELRLTGNTQGAGVFFIEGTVTQTGTFTWTGVIILAPGGVWDMRGTANIFGSVVTSGSSSSKAQLLMTGNGKIAWAADAINVGPFNMPGLMNSWREFK